MWQANAVAVGLTAGAVTAFDTVVKAARTAFTGRANAQQAAKAATVTLHNTLTGMRGTGADLIRTIRADAESTNNPAVYALAQIPPPATPTPTPPPGAPHDYTVQLTPQGALALSWKADNSAPSTGAFFTIRRRLGGEAGFTVLGGTGSRAFLDDTVPVGTRTVTYLIQGFRGQEPGPEGEQLTVQFGVGEGGGQGEMRLAA